MDFKTEKMEETVVVPKETIDYWESLLQRDDIDYEKEGLKKYETAFCKTVTFANGYQMDIKVCTDTPEDGTIWSEAVLFTPEGCEVACTEVSDGLLGEWELEWYDHGNGTKHVYMARVKESQTA